MLLLALAMGDLAAAGEVAGAVPVADAAGDIAIDLAAPGAGAVDVGDLTSMCVLHQPQLIQPHIPAVSKGVDLAKFGTAAGAVAGDVAADAADGDTALVIDLDIEHEVAVAVVDIASVLDVAGARLDCC